MLRHTVVESGASSIPLNDNIYMLANLKSTLKASNRLQKARLLCCSHFQHDAMNLPPAYLLRAAGQAAKGKRLQVPGPKSVSKTMAQHF